MMLCTYGVVRASHPDVSGTGVHGVPVRLVPHGPVAAIASELNGELLARRRDVDAHLGVVERAFRDGPVLPFRFGTVVTDEPALVTVMSRSAGRYEQLLGELDGLVQMTVKAVRSDDEAIRAVVASNDRLRRMVQRLRGSPAVADQLVLGESLLSAVEVMSERDAHEIRARLGRLAESVASDEVSSPTVVSVALLMQPKRLAELDQAVASLHDDYGTRMTFDYAGPMPPYSFVG